MKAEYINPFMNALANTFQTMLDCETHRGELELKGHSTPLFDVSGIIGLSGNCVGMVVLSLSRQVALKATSVMLMTEATEIDDDVIDAVGELANMVAGGAKTELDQLDLSVSLPSVVTGEDHEVRFPSNVTPICIPYETAWGPLKVEVGLAPVAEPIAV